MTSPERADAIPQAAAKATPSPARMTPDVDMQALKAAFEKFSETTAKMEQSYHLLEERVESLDRELQDKNRELLLTTEYLNSILDSMSDGVIAVDTRGVVITFNRSASEVLGYSAADVIGRPYRDVFGQDFASSSGRRATELRSKTETAVPVSERHSPIADAQGNTIGSVKVFQDLREIEELREQVRQKDRLAAVGEMAATVAHEIRNPLGGIRGFASLLERDIETEDPRQRLVQKILAGVKNLDRVVNELLEFTRPIELNIVPEDCAALVEAAIGYLDVDAERIAIEAEVAPGLHVNADSQKIRQVLLNLLLNAVQSIPESGRVSVAVEPIGDEVGITVCDTGTGIEKADLQRIFSPFFTTKEKGTGLGLAVAGKIVEGHGGRIEAASEPGKGSTFRVFLPKGDDRE